MVKGFQKCSSADPGDKAEGLPLGYMTRSGRASLVVWAARFLSERIAFLVVLRLPLAVVSSLPSPSPPSGSLTALRNVIQHETFVEHLIGVRQQARRQGDQRDFPSQVCEHMEQRLRVPYKMALSVS